MRGIVVIFVQVDASMDAMRGGMQSMRLKSELENVTKDNFDFRAFEVKLCEENETASSLPTCCIATCNMVISLRFRLKACSGLPKL